MPRPCDAKSPQHGAIPKTRRGMTATARPDDADIPTSSKPPPAAVRKIPDYWPTPKPGTGPGHLTWSNEDDSQTPSKPGRDTADRKTAKHRTTPKADREQTDPMGIDAADSSSSKTVPDRKTSKRGATPKKDREQTDVTSTDEADSLSSSKTATGRKKTPKLGEIPKAGRCRTYTITADEADRSTSPRASTTTGRNRTPKLRETPKAGRGRTDTITADEADRSTSPRASTTTVQPTRTEEEYSKLEQRLRDENAMLVLRKQRSIDVAEMMNVIRDAVKKHITKESSLRFFDFNCGSYYEKTKVIDTDEFDVLFYCRLPVTIKYDLPPDVPKYYCKLELTSSPDIPAELLCSDGRTLSPKGFKGYFQSLVEEAVKLFKDGQGVTRETRLRLGEIEVTQKDTSPAVTVTFRFGRISFDVVPAIEVMGWPSVCRPCPGKWLSKDDKRKCMAKVFVVAKHHSSEYMKGAEQCQLWRYGLNASEKQILLHAARQEIDGQDICRKAVYKLLKKDVAGVVQKHDQEEMCTYFAKTVMFHVYEKFPEVADWITTSKNQTKLRLRYLNALEYFMNALREKNLSHYFIPGENLLDKACYSVTGDREMKALLAYLSKRHEEYT